MQQQLEKPFATDRRLDQITHWITRAESEIAAYRSAVLTKHGPEAAEWATEDWLHALDGMEWPPCNSGSCWRNLTIASASRLAFWLNSAPEV